MANIQLTTTTNSIKVDFGVYSSGLSISKGSWRKDEVASITLNDNHVYMQMKDGIEWPLNYDAQSKGFTVDTVDAVAPTGLSDLYTKLSAMVA